MTIYVKKKKEYNTTNLPVFQTLENEIAHRDYYAHLLRWNHVLRLARIGMKILDIGTGPGELFELFYRNRYKPVRFLGVDIRTQLMKTNLEKWGDKGAEFIALDIVKEKWDFQDDWDIITSFECLEHIGKKNVPIVLKKMADVSTKNTTILISTPNYDGVNVADNHIIDGEIGELTYDELEGLIQEHFKIIKVYGTFASQKDYKENLGDINGLPEIFEKLHEYYDSNILSCIFAPLFPRQSRNCLWKLVKR